MKTLIVVDMQNDFITGSLGSEEAKKIVPYVKEKVEKFEGRVIFTMDTHNKNYLNTQEGKKLPVEHCMWGTKGWYICDELAPYVRETFDKNTFGSMKLPYIIDAANEEIELCGLCTDICVISNAMILKAALPEMRIVVDSKGCAGVTKESHENALNAMRAVQIEVI
ncbi:MAG: cysteine hydrolase [Clostridia bacterium]|nr:cysteine hydrolase [Clostridia bacterium]